MLALSVTRRNADWDAYCASLGKNESPAHGRKSEPTRHITKIRSVIGSLWLIFDSRNLQALDQKHESALEKRGHNIGVRLAGPNQAPAC
jgi:hypothetical protein